MVLEILNTLNQKRKNRDFKKIFSTILSQIAESLRHCSNRINADIEAIYYNFVVSQDGNLQHRVKLALQEMRADIRDIVKSCVSQPKHTLGFSLYATCAFTSSPSLNLIPAITF